MELETFSWWPCSGAVFRIHVPDLCSGSMFQIHVPDQNVLIQFSDFERIYWDSARSEYFIDRHRATFEVMAHWFMKAGPLVRPDNIPIDIFLNEITFYRLNLDTISEFLEIEGLLSPAEEVKVIRTFKQRLWDLFEHPESSLMAKMISFISVIAIICSTTIFCIETMPYYKSMG